VIFGEFREFLVGLIVDDGAFFNPADFILLRLHFEKPAVVFENFELLAVGHQTYALTYGSKAVVQITLPRGHINSVVLLMLHALATRSQDDQAQHYQHVRAMQNAASWSAAAFQSGA
jgi:hypothetical protein